MARDDGQAKDNASFALHPFLPTISIGIQAPKAKGYALPLKDWPADPKIANKLNQHLSILKTTVMKKLIFPAVAALTLGLASCSSDEVNPGNGGGTVNYAEGGYVRLSINMPSTKGTRATSNSTNDQFDDGLANEYAVKNATLVLFEENTAHPGEEKATFHSAYDLSTSMEIFGNATDQITSMTKIVKKTDKKAHTGNLYALVVLNNNDLLNVESTTNGLQVKNTAGAYVPITGTTDFATFSTMLSESKAAAGTVPAPAFASNVASKGIFMTNSPLVYNPTTTTQDYITLVDVTKSVYKTEKEAQNAPAADIYVERGVAKVTFSKKSSGKLSNGKGSLSGKEFNKTDPATGSTVKKVEYEIIGWNLDVTNQKSFLVRQINKTHFNLKSLWKLTSTGVTKTSNEARFVGTSEIHAQIGDNGNLTSKTYYRPYWALDPNYENYKDEFNKLTATPTLSKDFEDEHPQYCYENTFDVANQNQDQTTRVVVAVKLNFEGEAAADLYVFNGDRSKVYKEADAKTRVQQAILNTMKGKDGYLNLDATKVKVADIKFSGRDEATGVVTVTGCKVTNDAGTEVTVDATTTVKEVGATTGVNVLAAVNDEVKEITMYKGGVAYYPIRIKHFGDTYTPWSADMEGVSAGKIYPNGTDVNDTKESRYLGRYGVVRNNWYDLSVSDIKGVGTPVIPSTDNTPDDELYNYISVRINILSWAKRSQSEEL